MDHGESDSVRRPAVSIVLPTYNRERFLLQAFEAIRGQQFRDWELIVVDDGSSDNTRIRVMALSRGWVQPVRYVYQENRGAYVARNHGLDLARGEFIALFDSDDAWLPHHLKDCVAALEANPDVDWIYGAARRVEHATGRVLTPHTFYVDGKPRPFLGLRVRRAGEVRIIDDPRAVSCAIEHGFFCGLQGSVIRRQVFDKLRFQTRFRNESEDQVFAARAVLAGVRFAYLDDIHLTYYVHAANSSASADGLQLERHVRLLQELLRGYAELREQSAPASAARKALDRKLGREYFWCLGYGLFWRNGRYREALEMFRKGLRSWPWDLRCWKTYALARAIATVGPLVTPRGQGPSH